MIKRMYKFPSGISMEEKNRKIREIKEKITQYPELNKDTEAYFDENGTYVISVIEPTFIEKLKMSLKKDKEEQEPLSYLYGECQNSQRIYNNYR